MLQTLGNTKESIPLAFKVVGIVGDVPQSVVTPENCLLQERQGAKLELARKLFHKMRMEWNAPLNSSAC